MRRPILCFSVLCFLVSVPQYPVHADGEFKIIPVDPAPGVVDLGTQGIGDPCLAGNLNPAAYAIAGWLLPAALKHAFDPATTGDCAAICTVQPASGIDINAIHLYVQVEAACVLELRVDVEEVTYPTGPDCPEPGAVVCGSPTHRVYLPQAGGWVVNIPIECACLTFGKTYTLGAFVYSATCGFALGIDNTPTNCTNWFDWGSGWKDLVAEHNFPGNLRFWADATCCQPPVPVESRTWGSIKSLYAD